LVETGIGIADEHTTPTRRSIAVPLVSVNDDVAEQHQRR